MRKSILTSVVFSILTCLLFIGCGSGQYFTYKGLNPETALTAHYTYQDSTVTIAAGIRSGGIMGGFWYDIIVVNTGNDPFGFSWVGDNVWVKVGKKRYVLKNMVRVTSYPSALNPDKHAKLLWKLPGELNEKINDIDQVVYHNGWNDISYELSKNPDAKWEKEIEHPEGW